MNAPQCFPFTSCYKSQLGVALIFGLLLNLPGAMARDDADNPNQPDDLTPAEIAEPDPESAKWRETEIDLPPFPRAQDLLPVRSDAGGPGYNYYIDVNSVSLTDDEVLRYTIIIQSPRGSSNIVYEGIRCATQEIKVLAFGTRGGRFARMPDPRWAYVHTLGPLAYRTALERVTFATKTVGRRVVIRCSSAWSCTIPGVHASHQRKHHPVISWQ